jgi:hypothetical protein
MPMLTDLKLHSCEGINSSSMAALAHCVMLEVSLLNWLTRDWLLKVRTRYGVRRTHATYTRGVVEGGVAGYNSRST